MMKTVISLYQHREILLKLLTVVSNIIKNNLRKLVFLLTYYFYVQPNLKKVSYLQIERYRFIVYPTVFNPRYSVSSKVFASFISNMHDLNGKSVLDMGCGSGTVSVFACSKGAVCIASDINPMAVKATTENADKNGFPDKIKVIESNLFENPFFKGSSFDIIFFNPPYHRGMPKNNFEAAYKGGMNFEVIRNFLGEAKNYLKENGYICMLISSDMGISEFKGIADSFGLKPEITAQMEKFFETFYIMKIVI